MSRFRRNLKDGSHMGVTLTGYHDYGWNWSVDLDGRVSGPRKADSEGAELKSLKALRRRLSRLQVSIAGAIAELEAEEER